MFKRMTDTCAALGLAAAGCILLATAAEAQAVRFIATSGSNANACTREAPCRTLQRGINRTPEGGELQILDSGAYGNAAIISRSITISAEGVNATVGAITINAVGATVVLRNLLLNGRNAPANAQGILITNVGRIQILGCEIEGFVSDGIRIVHALSVFIADTNSRNNGGSGLSDMDGTSVTVDNSRFVHNTNGISFGVGSRATVTRSLLNRNSSHGITSLGFSRGTIVSSAADANGGVGILVADNSRVTVASSVAAENGSHGFLVQNSGELSIEASLARENASSGVVSFGGIAVVSNSTVTRNSVGLRAEGGFLFSRQNNTVFSNGTNTVGPISALGPI